MVESEATSTNHQCRKDGGSTENTFSFVFMCSMALRIETISSDNGSLSPIT
jgi:hypothetical protein